MIEENENFNVIVLKTCTQRMTISFCSYDICLQNLYSGQETKNLKKGNEVELLALVQSNVDIIIQNMKGYTENFRKELEFVMVQQKGRSEDWTD